MKNKIFIACDTTNIKQVKKIIKYTENKKLKIGYKFGLEFFYSKQGRSFISKLRNKIVWLDLKLYDISNTVASSVNALLAPENNTPAPAQISGVSAEIKASAAASISVFSGLCLVNFGD